NILRAARQSLQVRGDRGDLFRTVSIFKTGHARRSVADDLSHILLVAAGAVFGELRSEHAGDERRPRVAHAAGLLEEAPAELLLGIELLVMVLIGRGERLRHARDKNESDP